MLFVFTSRRSSATSSPRGSEKSYSSSLTSEESASTTRSTSDRENAGVQTGGELLKKYEPVTTAV